MTDLELAAKALMNARTIVCFSGAGISADSGIPTYRDSLTGLWASHSPQYLETARAFRDNPQLVWGWYLWRRQMVARSKPNAAHFALQKIADTGRSVSIITQNVDDLHERAGSKAVLHLHGCLDTAKCFACNRPAALTSEQLFAPDAGSLVEPPRCARCNGKLRPGVVWYGEDLPRGAWKKARLLAKKCDVLLSVGTSGVVTPAAHIPDIALSSGVTVIHINTVDVAMGQPNELMLIGKATEVFTHLCTIVLREREDHDYGP